VIGTDKISFTIWHQRAGKALLHSEALTCLKLSVLKFSKEQNPKGYGWKKELTK
jgi:hypothetical protein